MNDLKVFIKVDPSKELPKEKGSYHVDYGTIYFEGTEGVNPKWYRDFIAMVEGASPSPTPEYWLKEIYLTELMVGFAEWKEKNETELNYHQKQTNKELVNKYFKSKGIVL